MSLIFLICAVISMVVAALSLAVGLASIAKTPEFREKYANRLMRLRILSQGAAILFLFLAFSTQGA